MIQASYSQASNFLSLIGSNLQVAGVWRLGLFDPSKLEADEYIQFLGLATAMLRNFENVFIQFQDSAADPRAWEPWDRSLRDIMQTRGLKVVWQERKAVFGDGFRSHVDGLLTTLPTPVARRR
jgi:hypothetical protein